jgi:hypothetical protein
MGRIGRPTVLLLLATIALLHEVPAAQGTAAAAAAGITIVYDPQHESGPPLIDFRIRPDAGCAIDRSIFVERPEKCQNCLQWLLNWPLAGE